MHYSDLIQLYFERSNSLQSYWTLYVVVIGGVLAFASLRLRPDVLTTALVTILFVCFAFRNIGAIHDVSMQREAVLQTIQKTASLDDAASVRDTLNPTLLPTPFASSRNFHVLCDILTILTLWAMELRRRRYASADAAVRL